VDSSRRNDAPAERLRLFFALWPDAATRAALAAWSRAIHAASGGRAVRPEILHITLAFLGQCDSARLPALQAAAASVRLRPFKLVVDDPGYWHHHQLAWAGARTTPAELRALVTDLRAALTAREFSFDPKPFVPHVTLIRKARAGFAVPRVEPIHWRIQDFALIRSIPGREGSVYTVEGRWR
jgi:2'-5' RNA ligase